MVKRGNGLRFWMSVATLSGTVIGAGILGIPYVISKSGFLLGSLIILFVSVVFLLLNLMFGELILRTKGYHQFVGYMGRYLGKKWKPLALVISMFSIYGALIAYLIGSGHAMASIFGGGSLFFTLIFFIFTTIIIIKGFRSTGWNEIILVLLLIIVVFIIGIFNMDKISFSNLSTFNPVYLFVPYGVILFAMNGIYAIPEANEMLDKHKKYYKKVIIIGSMIPAFIYILFSLIVLGIVGEGFSFLSAGDRIATVALSLYTNKFFGIFANLFAVLSMLTSFLAMGLAMREIYEYDYGMGKIRATILTVTIPLIIALSGFTNFISVIAFTGAFAVGIEGIMISLAYYSSRKNGERRPEYTLKGWMIYPIITILAFCLGIIYEILTYVGIF